MSAFKNLGGQTHCHRLPDFEYIRFESLSEALNFLGEHGAESKVLAGGTDLIIQMRNGKVKPKYVVDVTRIGELKGIGDDGELIHIGALSSLAEIEASRLIMKSAPILVDTINIFGF